MPKPNMTASRGASYVATTGYRSCGQAATGSWRAREENMLHALEGEVYSRDVFFWAAVAESSGIERAFFVFVVALRCFWRQVGIMLAQRRYGRNFMVPSRFQPPKFDYHRPIPPELSEQVPHFFVFVAGSNSWICDVVLFLVVARYLQLPVCRNARTRC